MNASLDRALVAGMAWTAVLRWAAQIISWAGTFYAARLLVPADYGLVSMAMLGIGLARMVEDFGMDSVLVQDRGITGVHRARLAGFVLMLGVALCGIFALLAPAFAGFFREPGVAVVIVALSVLFITDALQVVPRAELQRRLEFRRLAVAMFVQVVATQVALIAAARVGWGHWSLVVNHVAGALAVTLLLVAWHPFAIAWPRELRHLAQPLLQGWRILASRAAWYGYSNADQTIIGRVLGKDALGAYSFATTLSTLAQQEVGSVVSRVVPGIFSEVQNRPEALRRYFLMLTEFLTLLTFPVSIGTALTADLVVPLLLGPQWSAVIVPLQLLCMYSAFLSSQTLISHVLMWTGQFRINMWCSILAAAIMPVALFISVRYGLEGIGWTWLLVFPLVNIPAFLFAFRTLQISAGDWLEALKPAGVGCLVMALAVAGARAVTPESSLPLAAAGLAVGVGALVYPLTLWLVFRARMATMIALAGTLRHPAPAGA